MSSLKEQNDALTQSYDNREHDMQMDWFIRGGAMVGAASCSGSPAHAPAPSQEQRALDELIARAVNRMKGRQRRPFHGVSGEKKRAMSGVAIGPSRS